MLYDAIVHHQSGLTYPEFQTIGHYFKPKSFELKMNVNELKTDENSAKN